MPAYDPKEYWNEKARRFRDDPTRAACAFDSSANRCIEQVQRTAIENIVRKLGGTRAFYGKLLLDFGCGSGRWVGYFRDLGATYRGVDISDEMVAICRGRYPSLDFASMDGFSVPAPSESFDYVFSIGVLHHNRRHEQDLLLNEITRVIKPGGYLVLFEALGSVSREREFPRTLRDWKDGIVDIGYECLLQKRYHYFPVSRLMESIGKRLSSGYTNHWRIIRLDAAVSPVMSKFILTDPGARAAMLFRRIG
jgi:SAM-dependent methyltransferase